MDGAKRLGERLMDEVEVESLSSLFSSLWKTQKVEDQCGYFNIPRLDALMPSPEPPISHNHQDRPHLDREPGDLWTPDVAQQQPALPAQATAAPSSPAIWNRAPILELISPPSTHHASPSGKTALLYLVCAHAILQSSICAVPVGGLNASIILFDPLSHFSIPRLASVMASHILSKFREKGEDASTDERLRDEIRAVVRRSLKHVHIFRPQSWETLMDTLKGLPEYLFDESRHGSMGRLVHSVVMEDVDAFAWSVRGSSTSNPTTSSLAAASARLTHHLTRLKKLLSCAVILTSHSSSPTVLRAPIPNSWPGDVQVTKLAMRKVGVVKFAPGISVEEAETERAQRWEIVSRGRFECWRLGSKAGQESARGFTFRVGRGVEVEGD